MSRWFRHYAGMMSDPKFGGVARFCKRSRAEVLFVWGCLLESASEYDSAVYSWDADAMAELLGIETEEAQAIHDGLAAKGLIADGRIGSWDKRQFTSDDSKERVKAHRKRKKAVTGQPANTNVTGCNGDVTAPEAETDTDTDTTTIAKALVVVAPKSALKPKPTMRCPDAWSPSKEDLDVGAEEGFSPGEIDRELAKIRDFEFATARADWSAVFRNWLRRAAETRPTRQGQAHERPHHSAKLDAKQANMDRSFRAAQRVAAREPVF